MSSGSDQQPKVIRFNAKLLLPALALFFATSGASGLNAHPRIWLTPQLLSDLAAKRQANDPDWAAIKTAADGFLNQVPPKLTVTGATNAGQVQFTTAESIPWTGTVAVYLAGGTGGWAAVNNQPPAGAWNATKTGNNTFSVPVDTSASGSFSGQAIRVFIAGGESAAYLSYGQTGSGWYDAFLQLGLVYKVTGTTSYATKALSLLDYINTLGAAGMVSPVTQDSGRGSMGATFGLAIAYDWFYDLLSPAQRTATYKTLNTWNTWTTQNAYAIHDPTSNYWAAHVTAAAATGYATFEENPSAQTWINWANNNWSTDFAPKFFNPPSTTSAPLASGDTSGFYYGGLAVSGFNYGGNDIARLLKYMLLVKSATGTNLFSNTDYAQRWARNLIYQLKPDRWKSPNFGQWTGSWYGVMTRQEALLLTAALDGTTEGAWMQWFYDHSGQQGNNMPAGALDMVSPSVQDRLMFYKSTRTSTDYRSTEPPYFFSDGGEGWLYRRSDWSDGADYALFGVTTSHYSGSHPRHAGHVDLSRGSDYLLVQSNYWKGTGDGSSGVPEMNDVSGSLASTLYFWDGGTSGGGKCFANYPYDGCQLGFGVYKTPKQKQTADFSFGENEFATAYDYNQVPSARTLQYFFRSFVALGNGYYVVYDRIKSTSASHTKQIRWQLSSANAPTLSGDTITSAVGASKLFIKTVSPSGATQRLVRNTSGSTPVNWRAEVTDPAPALAYTGLTVLRTSASNGTLAPVTELTTIDTNFRGLQIADATARVVVLPKGVTAVTGGTFTSTDSTGVTFTTTHSGTGNYVVAGLAAGTYAVARNGAGVSGASSVDVDASGVLFFSSSSGAFSITQTAAAPAGGASGSPSPPPPSTSPQTDSSNTYRCTNNEFVMTDDITLTGTQSVELVGTSGTPCRISGNNHRFIVDGGGGWTGHLTFDYADAVDLGTATLSIVGGPGTSTYAYLNGGYIDIQHSSFRRSGGFNLYTVNGATVRFSYNEYGADNLVPAGGPASQAASWFFEQGTSTATKYFQGNHVFKASVNLGSKNWIAGAPTNCASTCDRDGNIMIGRRVGLAITGSGSYAAYNYIHVNLDVTPNEDYWSQVGNIGPIGAGAVAEHNVFRAGHWIASVIDGELRYNVLAEPHGHDFVRLGNGGAVHHNVLTANHPGVDTYSTGTAFVGVPTVFGLFQTGNSLSIYNNTIDARGLGNSLLWVRDGAMVNSYRNNVAYRLRLSASGCPTSAACTSAVGVSDTEGYMAPAPSRALYLDYNDFFFDQSSPRKIGYAIGVQGKSLGSAGWGGSDLGQLNDQGLDPQFRGPLPLGTGNTGVASSNESGFPFNDADILSGVYRVSDILSYFRWVYSPASASPLRGRQSPSDGAGDMGAVQTSTLPASAPSIVTTNKRPMVYAGPSFSTGTSSLQAKLSGYAADDALPNGALSVQWSVVSGPGTVTFANDTTALTSATFSTQGVYVLRLTASDGLLTSTDDVEISAGVSQPSTLRAPTNVRILP